MKPIINLLLLVSLAGCSNPNRVHTGLEGKPLPAFNVLLPDSATKFNTAKIPQGQPVVIFDFGPYCPYSRAEMADILANMSAFRQVRFLLLTNANFHDMLAFYNTYHLENFPNITIGQDSLNFFGNYFNVPGVPYMAVYDPQKRLKDVLMGKMEISLLKASVTE